MADNRKTFESTPPQPASGNIPDPAATTPGADVGGIPKTADSGLGDSIDSSPDMTGVKPRSAASAGSLAGESTPTPVERPRDQAAESDAKSAEDESPLESLGKAIGAPLSGEAAKEEPRR